MVKKPFSIVRHIRKFLLHALLSKYEVSKGSQISENKEVPSPNGFTFLLKLFVRSLIYIRKTNGPATDSCGTPA